MFLSLYGEIKMFICDKWRNHNDISRSRSVVGDFNTGWTSGYGD